MRKMAVLVIALWIAWGGAAWAADGRMSFDQFKTEWNKELGAIAEIKSIKKQTQDHLLVDFGEGTMLTVFIKDGEVYHAKIMCLCDNGSGVSRLMVATEKLLRVFLPKQSQENRKIMKDKLVKPGQPVEFVQDGVKFTRVITPPLGWDVDAAYLTP